MKTTYDLMLKMRKPNTKIYSVSASLIQSVGSDDGHVVVTTRDNLGSLVDKNVTTLQNVKKRGIPMPNPINIIMGKD